MKHRVKAYIKYPASSGMATWCRDQMAVRFAQSVHINTGQANEETPVNELDTSEDPHTFQCDLILADSVAALDAYVNLTSASVIAHMAPPDPEGPPFFVEYHICDHDEENQSGCVIEERIEFN